MTAKTNATATSAAYSAGRTFAAELNATPMEAQNWSALDDSDELPEEDYMALDRAFGEVTEEMEDAYRAGFNDTFVEVAGE